MASTVNQAFDEFMKNHVNLDPNDTKDARSSKDWLFGQLDSFGASDEAFPESYVECHISYGSFSRRTKKRPLDDIDLMVCMKGNGCTYLAFQDRVEVHVPDNCPRFRNYVNEGTNILNSKKIINAYVAKLGTVGQYRSAEIKRNLEAVTLNLVTHDWVYDIVPCFITAADHEGRTYYLIPDGKGHWKRTDPRLDAQRLKAVNDKHQGRVLNVIRLVKYWNKRKTMPDMGSYLLENMILDYYEGQAEVASEFVDIECVKVILDIYYRVYKQVLDPKDIQGDLNNLSDEDKAKIRSRAADDYYKAKKARELEGANNHKDSIYQWKQVFGDDFPNFT